MGDTIQYLMEKMIPELDDFQKRNIFNKKEIQEIIQKRRNFEYMMKRRPLRKIDGLRYIEYEINLDALAHHRKERLKNNKNNKDNKDNYIGRKRIHFIFTRMLKKFKGDMELWLQYINYCKNIKSNKLLAQAYTRALQMLPRNESLWIEAASWEFSSNLNPDGARSIMQRALRINKTCKKLWIEYFRLEFLFIQKIRNRRLILGINDNHNMKNDINNKNEKSLDKIEDLDTIYFDDIDNNNKIDLNNNESSEKDKENKQNEKDNEKDDEKDDENVLDGSIPILIYENAIEEIPNDILFHNEFLTISDLFPTEYSENVSTFIINSIKKTFPNDILAWKIYASRFVMNKPLITMEDYTNSIKRFNEAILYLSTQEIREETAFWFENCIIDSCRKDDNTTITQFLIESLTKLYNGFIKNNQMSEILYLHWIDLLVRSNKISLNFIENDIQPKQMNLKNINILNHCETAVHTFPESYDLWVLYVQLLLRLSFPSVQDGYNKVLSLLENKALKNIKQVDKRLKIHWIIIQIYLKNETENEMIHIKFQNALKESGKEGILMINQLRKNYINWFSENEGYVMSCKLCFSFIESNLFGSDESTYSFMEICMETMNNYLNFEQLKKNGNINKCYKYLEKLHEKRIEFFGNRNIQIWFDYILFYRNRQMISESNTIYLRAKRQLNENDKQLISILDEHLARFSSIC